MGAGCFSPHSPNHSLYLIKLTVYFCYPGGNFRGSYFVWWVRNVRLGLYSVGFAYLCGTCMCKREGPRPSTAIRDSARGGPGRQGRRDRPGSLVKGMFLVRKKTTYNEPAASHARGEIRIRNLSAVRKCLNITAQF